MTSDKVRLTTAAMVMILGASIAIEAAAQSRDEWVARITAIQNDDPGAWRTYFALGQELAELPGREGLEIIEQAWPVIDDARLKQQIIKAWQFDLPTPFRTRMHSHTFEFFSFVLAQDNDDAGSQVVGYLPRYAWRTFDNANDAKLWLAEHRNLDGETVATESMEAWSAAVRSAEEPAEHVNALSEIGYPLRRNPKLIEAARAAGLEATLLKAFEDPAVTTDAISYGYSMLSELRPDAYPSHGLEAFLEPFAARARAEEAAAQAAILESLDVRSLDGDERKRWIVHAPRAQSKPPLGWGLLIVAPGGAGTIDFAPFVRDTIQSAAGDDYVVILLIAPPIEEGDGNAIVWPREQLKDDRVDFTMEPIVLAAIDQAMKEFAIDRERIRIMGWSSGGPLAYEMAVREGSPVRGAFVIMSVFKPDLMSPLSGAKGKSFYILHSPDDFIAMRFPKAAEEQLTEAGARAHLQTYEGGHGWHGDIAAQIRDAIRWLDNTEN